MTNLENASVEQVVDTVVNKTNQNKSDTSMFGMLDFVKMDENETKAYLLSDMANQEGGKDILGNQIAKLQNFLPGLIGKVKAMFNPEIQKLKVFLEENKNNALLLGELKQEIENQKTLNIELAIQQVKNPSVEAVQSKPLEVGEVATLYNEITGERPSRESFMYAMSGYNKLKNQLGNSRYLTVVDYTKSREEDRGYIIDLENKKVEYCVPVGHGKKSGGKFATSFSDVYGSNKTSLGFYRTPKNITKANTKSRSGLLLKGIEESNDQATNRGIYMHPGSVEGSEGCFTLPENANSIMKKVKGDSLIFAYYPDHNYLAQSSLIETSSPWSDEQYPQVA